MSYNCICEEGSTLPSSPNEIQLLLAQIKREVEELTKTTEAKLLCHDGKIAELCMYVKDNLSNTVRCLLDSMQQSGELDKLIADSVLTGFNEVYDKLDGIYSVKNFGAKGDGLSDDTKAIKEALQLAEKNNGILFFNPGLYRITDSIDITKPIKIMGLSEKGTTASGPIYGAHIRQENPTKNIFNFSGTNNYYGVEISCLRLEGSSVAINIDTTGYLSEFIFEKIHFNGGFKECIHIGNATIGRISDCDFSSNEIGINAELLNGVTISENNFWQNRQCHIKFGNVSDSRVINNWFEKTIEEGCSLLCEAPFALTKVIFLNNEFRSTKTPTLLIDGNTKPSEIAHISHTIFENCRMAVGQCEGVAVVRVKDNTNQNSSTRIHFENCLFSSVKTSAIYSDYKWLYYTIKNSECFKEWSSGKQEMFGGSVKPIVTVMDELTGYSTNGVINLTEITDSTLITENAIYCSSDNQIKMMKHGKGQTFQLGLSGNRESRPTENLFVGMMFYDYSIGKPIFYTGSNWVDATGQTV